MEQFNVEIHRTVDNKDGTFYYELSPTNIELKDMLLKLQSFTMDTNNKLVNIIFNDSPRFINEQDEDEETDCPINFNTTGFNASNFIELSQEGGFSGFNLKEMIQHELCKNMSSEQLDEKLDSSTIIELNVEEVV